MFSALRLLLLAFFLFCCLSSLAHAGVSLGIDTLRDEGFAAVRGKRIGLVTNQTSTDAGGQKDRVILRQAAGVELAGVLAVSEAASVCSAMRAGEPATALKSMACPSGRGRRIRDASQGLDRQW